MSQEKKKAVYIAGKMRGLPLYGFPLFDAARDRLVKLGFEALSPADMDRATGFDPARPEFQRYDMPLKHDAIDNRVPDWSRLPSSFDLKAAIERDNKAIDDPATVAIYVIHEGIAESAGGMAEIERGMKAGKIILFDTMDDAQILKALGMSETVSASAEFKAEVDSVMNEYGKLHAFGELPSGKPRTASSLKEEYDAFSKDCCERLGIENVFDPILKKAKEAIAQLPRYTEREGVLDEAKKLITGDRNNSYGPPTQDFQRTADMMSALFSAKLKDGARFKPSDVAWIITLVKASRAQHSPKRDNYVDAAGYMGCGWECEAEDLKRETPGV